MDVKPFELNELKPKSIGEETLALHLRAAGIHHVREHKFHPARKWRFDFALPESRIAVEVEGGVWSKGRHTRGSGFMADCDKYNTAAAMGWYVFRFPTEQVKSGTAIQVIEDAHKRIGSNRLSPPMP